MSTTACWPTMLMTTLFGRLTWTAEAAAAVVTTQARAPRSVPPPDLHARANQNRIPHSSEVFRSIPRRITALGGLRQCQSFDCGANLSQGSRADARLPPRCRLGLIVPAALPAGSGSFDRDRVAQWRA